MASFAHPNPSLRHFTSPPPQAEALIDAIAEARRVGRRRKENESGRASTQKKKRETTERKKGERRRREEGKRNHKRNGANRSRRDGAEAMHARRSPSAGLSCVCCDGMGKDEETESKEVGEGRDTRICGLCVCVCVSVGRGAVGRPWVQGKHISVGGRAHGRARAARPHFS